MTPAVTRTNTTETPLLESGESQADIERRVKNCYKTAKNITLGVCFISIAGSLATEFTICSDLTREECSDKYKYPPVLQVTGLISGFIIMSKILADRYCRQNR